MAQRSAKSKARAFFISDDLHPQTIAVIETRAAPLGIEIVRGAAGECDPASVFGAIFQYPGTFGHVRDLSAECEALHAAGGVAVVATDLLALCLLKEPGAMGADICVGSAQRFGVPMGYGGPHAGFMSCRDDLKRSMPGRIVGVSIDAAGRQAYRLSLQTREQHIRREKATSNVCTAQALLAVMASFYAVFHGPMGLRAIAQRVHLHAATLAAALREAGADVQPDAFFDTVTVRVGVGQQGIMAAARHRGINLRRVGRDRVGISVDETTDAGVIARVLDAFGITDAAEPADAPDPHGPAAGTVSERPSRPVWSAAEAEDAWAVQGVDDPSGERPDGGSSAEEWLQGPVESRAGHEPLPQHPAVGAEPREQQHQQPRRRHGNPDPHRAVAGCGVQQRLRAFAHVTHTGSTGSRRISRRPASSPRRCRPRPCR